MRGRSHLLALLALTGLATVIACAPSEEHGSETIAYMVPVEYLRLDNGLRVVLSRETTAPVVIVAVYYNIGFRIEPKDRTGFAHLFEHMMFQGSENLRKGDWSRLVNESGGVDNGSTRFDFTNYFEIVPAHKLETMLWAEADRMKGLKITQEELTNQQGVVANEIKVNVLNQPYGGFPWLDLPQAAFDNWYNSHNFYGDLEDLEAATLEEVQAFFDAYYGPNNAVLVVVGDFEPAQARSWIEQYFADIPAAELQPKPDLTEAPQQAERRGSRIDPFANRPAFSFAYRMPQRNSPDYWAMILLDQVLLQGNDSLLYQSLVQRNGMTGSIEGGINWPLGNAFNYNGPNLWSAYLFHDENLEADSIVAELDRIVEQLQREPLAPEVMERALVKLRSSFFDEVGGYWGLGKADLLACFALFDDDPGRINQLEQQFRKVTAEDLLRAAREVLRPENRTIFTIQPGAEAAEEEVS